MKKLKILFVMVTAGILVFASCSTGQNYSGTRLRTTEDTVSYYLGITYGTSMKENDVQDIFNYNAFAKGIQDAIDSDTLPVSQMEMNVFLQGFFNDLQESQLTEQYEDYIAENEAFLEENSLRDSVVTLPNGLQYLIKEAGTGPVPSDTDRVEVHYSGYLIDGTKFDSSVDRGEPAVFNVNAVIEGWSQIVQMMPVGSLWRVWIPSEMAYGANSPQGSVIIPFSTLVFDIELLSINPEE